MLKTRMKRLASQSEIAQQRLAEIEAVITALGNEDLLDFADIFTANPVVRCATSPQPKWRGVTSA
jgi:hypothetical protein